MAKQRRTARHLTYHRHLTYRLWELKYSAASHVPPQASSLLRSSLRPLRWWACSCIVHASAGMAMLLWRSSDHVSIENKRTHSTAAYCKYIEVQRFGSRYLPAVPEQSVANPGPFAQLPMRYVCATSRLTQTRRAKMHTAHTNLQYTLREYRSIKSTQYITERRLCEINFSS